VETNLAPRGFCLGILCAFFAAEILAADVEGWSDAPADWIIGLDRGAFCDDGVWTFESRGNFVIIGKGSPAPPARLTSDDAFFAGYYKSPVHWSLEGPVFEELTTFKIRRGPGRGLSMEGFVGDAPAVSRQFENVELTGLLWARKVDAATCEDDEPPLIEITNAVTGCCGGGRVVSRARLAAAGDGALIVQFDRLTCSMMCLSRKRERRYARFRAIQAPER
jgi:hypothetical protein